MLVKVKAGETLTAQIEQMFPDFKNVSPLSRKQLASTPLGGGVSSSLAGSGGRLFREKGAKNTGAVLMVNADPAHFGQMGPALEISYANSVTPSIVDGRMFVRGLDGMYCYDLRGAAVRDGDVGLLTKGLAAADPRLVRCVVNELGRLGPRAVSAVQDLKALLQAKDAVLRDAAKSALETIPSCAPSGTPSPK